MKIDLNRQAALLALLVFAAYLNSLTSSFHFDDGAIFKVPGIVSPGLGLDLFGLEYTRPLTWLTFHWNFLIGGKTTLLYHVVNMLLHAANVVLLLIVARRYLSPLTAFCVAAVFALHPIQTESVTYIYARSTLLSTHFALWTLWFFARGRYLASAVFFGVSLLAKEETIALPGFLLLLDWFDKRRPNLRYYAALASMMALMAAHLFYLILASPLDPGVGRVRGITTLDYLLSQSRVMWIYLRILVAPYDLNLDRDVPVSTNLLSPWTTLPAILLLATLLGALAWLAWKKRSAAALWVLGFFVLIAPSSSIVAQADLIYEHRTYLPLVPLLIGLGFLLQRLPSARLLAGIAVLAPVMLLATVVRNSDWQDEKTLSADIAAKSPHKGRAWLAMADAWPDDPVKKREYLEKGLSVDPGMPELHNNYGILLLTENLPAEAMQHFRNAMAIAGESADAWNNIGGAYYRLNDADAALNSFQRALKLDPCSFNAHRNTMMIFSTRHDNQAAYQAGLVPDTCAMLPDQARELAQLRLRMLTP